MKPASFEYVRAQTVAQAIAALAGADGEGKILAGGQSLMPMVNFRLVQPRVLVDINRIEGLDRIEDLGDRLRIGALVRHRMTAADPLIAAHAPVLHEAMKHVAHLTVRNRGTFVGSLCHADPAAEMPMLALLLDAEVEIASPAGPRTVPADAFLAGSLTTALAADELVTAVTLAKLAPGVGWGFAEFARRHGDYALAAACASMQRRGGAAYCVRIAVMGVGEKAMRLPSVEASLEGREPDEAVIAEAVARLRADIVPMSDLSASAEYRRHLAGELAGNVLRDAWSRVGEGRGV